MQRRARTLASLFRAGVCALCILSGGADARTLPLPEGLISLDSEQGRQLLLDSEAREAYWPLSIQFVTQQNLAYCGVASLVMILNALGIDAPPAPDLAPYRVFTQDNVLNDETNSILARAVLRRQGMTLDQLGQLLEFYGVETTVYHAGESDPATFRRLAARHLAERDHHVIVNFLRSAIGEESGGHISPLAAFDADSDRFLLLDVSRYKYPPVWVKSDELFAAMNTVPGENDGAPTRGFALISGKRP